MAVSVVPWPVMKMTGMRASIVRMRRNASRPDMSGRFRSRTTTSGRLSVTAASPRPPSEAVRGRRRDREGPAEGMEDGSLVVDHQNGRHVGPPREFLARSLRRRQAKDKAGSALRPVRRPEAAAVVASDPLGDHQAQPEPGFLTREERLVEPGQVPRARCPDPCRAPLTRRNVHSVHAARSPECRPAA